MNHTCVRRFREKLNRLTVSDYHGLVSPGLTCYLNSILHVLFMTKDFRDSIKRCCSDDQTTIDSLLRELFSDLERGSAETRSITEKLGITDVYEQRDAAEYFEKIMCLTSAEASKMFKGELNHKITCDSCKSSNNSRGFFWILPLSMENASSRIYSVSRGLKAFFRRERVLGEDRMYCDHCCAKRDTVIGCDMTQHPEILTLLLKRFTYNPSFRRYEKLLCPVKVPQTFHIQECEYELYALVHHFGSLTGGHYTAQIQSFENGDWYCFNDKAVDRVKEPLFGSGGTSLKSQTAYLLMYKKVSSYSEKDQCAGSDVVAVRTPSQEESVKLLNGESFSLELENRPHLREAHVRRHTDGDGRFPTKSKLSTVERDGESYWPFLQTRSEDLGADFLPLFGKDFKWNTTQKQNDIARNDRARTESRSVSDGYQNKSGRVREMSKEEKVGKRGQEGDVDVKSVHGSSSSSSPSAPAYPPRRSHSNGHAHSAPFVRRRSSSITRDYNNIWTPEAARAVTTGSERKKKNAENSKETIPRPPWK